MGALWKSLSRKLPWGKRLRDLLEDNMRQQVTKLGFVVTLAVVLVGLAAFVSGNNLLFLLLAALLATLLISGFISRLGLAGLELNITLPEHVVARRRISGRLAVKNSKWLVPSFSLHLTGSPASGLVHELYLPLISAGATLMEPVELLFDRRGVYKDNTFWFSSRFPFGFTHRRAEVCLEQEVLVYPPIDPQPGFEDLFSELAGEIEARQRGRGTDFYRIRPYEVLESVRHVDWRATAHTGDLQVREFAREQEQTVTVFLDLNVPDAQLAWFEHAINCSAFLAWRLHERGSRLRFVTQKFDRRVPEESSVYDVLRYLARVEPVRVDAPFMAATQETTVALTANRTHAAEAGWGRGRILTPEDLPEAQPPATTTAITAATPGPAPGKEDRTSAR